MTNIVDLDELEQLRKAAAQGEWEVYTSNSFSRVGVKGRYHEVQGQSDSKYIAAAHNALPDLIAELRAYRRLQSAAVITATWPNGQYFGMTMTHYGGSSLVEKLNSLPTASD